MIKNILTFIYDGIRKDLGTPAKLMKLIDACPEMRVEIKEPAHSVAYSSVVPWHRWGERSLANWPRRPAGTAVGWRKSGDYYSSFTANLAPLARIGQQMETEIWTCDIQDVSGLSASKSTLTDFTSLDELVETNSVEMIKDISQDGLAKNLSHNEIRILHEKSFDHFARHLWDGRIFLLNSGGSHHFSAARYIAARIGASVPLKGKLVTYSLDEVSVHALCSDYELFVISDEAKVVNAFHDALESFRTTYLWVDMPATYENTRAILLPKNEARSIRVAKELRQAGMFDLGQYLTNLCNRQNERMAA